MRVYLASNFASQDRMKGVRRMLERLGHEVTSTWLDEDGAQSYELNPQFGPGYAIRDRGEVEASDILILDTLEQSNTGGREVELGLALATGKRTWRVGPARNIFHTVVGATFDDWESCYEKL